MATARARRADSIPANSGSYVLLRRPIGPNGAFGTLITTNIHAHLSGHQVLWPISELLRPARLNEEQAAWARHS